MLCDECGKNPARIKMVSIVGGEKREVNLCPECAARHNLTPQAGGIGKDQRAVSDAGAHGRFLRGLLIHMDGVEVSGETGKHHDVCFGDRACGSVNHFAYLKFVEVSAGGFVIVIHN